MLLVYPNCTEYVRPPIDQTGRQIEQFPGRSLPPVPAARPENCITVVVFLGWPILSISGLTNNFPRVNYGLENVAHGRRAG